jgi:branched-chain amino acid transport system ATP-binding protein
MSDDILQVSDLEVTYDGSGLGLQGVSLRVGRGQLVAMLGANGAGKTTTLRSISGFLPSDSASITRGSVVFDGRRVERLAPHRRVALGVAIVPEREKIFRKLTVEENLRVCALQRQQAGELATLVYDLFPALLARRKTAAGYLSGGERQMLGIGRALMSSPDLLLADEVSLGIAPNLVVTMLDALRQINQTRGTSILLVEQNAAAALRVADYVYVLENGRAVVQGTPAELLGRSDVIEAYLGFGTTESDDDRRAGRLAPAVTWG